MYVVGHSLGAQLGGTIGRNVIQQSKQGTHLHRITGLDPAGPLFYPDLPIILEENHLTEKDAEFVDIIHTDSGGYGYPLQTGSADFFVNSGHRFQPGCGTENQKGIPVAVGLSSLKFNFVVVTQVAVAVIIVRLTFGPKVC